MAQNVGKEIAALERMTVKQLRARHIAVFGKATRSGHREYLVKRITWRKGLIRCVPCGCGMVPTHSTRKASVVTVKSVADKRCKCL